MKSSVKYVLVPGGAGYIGSHTVAELLKTDCYLPVVVDNLYNSSKECISRIAKFTGKEVPFYNIDLTEDPKTSGLEDVFRKYQIYAVINFAALKAVGESVKIPLAYYSTNLGIAFNLLNTMEKFGVKNMIFPSSACVYGTPKELPLLETHEVGNCSNPYGRSKYFIEMMLRDLNKSDPQWNIVILRYFNPVGAHESGEIGEDPRGLPNNLMPYVTQVAVGKLLELSVFGNDYNTADGTGIRDYIHVVDLASGHIAALKQCERNGGLKVYNLGTGKGYSVLELVEGMKKASGRNIPYKVVSRREGDVALLYSDVSLAEKELGWKATRGIDEMCADAWRWQIRNPNGFQIKGAVDT